MNNKSAHQKWHWSSRTRALANLILGGISVPALLLRLRKLKDCLTPEALVDFSLNHVAIRPQQNRSEFLEFAHLVADARPRAAFEIGTYRGGTLFVIARLAAPDATIISVDLPATTFGPLVRAAQAPLLNSFIRERQKLHLLRENSHETGMVLRISEILAGQKLDLLFIDGDHSYGGVRSDFEMYSPLVRKGGLVAFHDIAEGGTRDFWGEVKGSYQNLEIIHGGGRESMGIGVLWF
jgi:predicted O-methyltransferase YrrM